MADPAGRDAGSAWFDVDAFEAAGTVCGVFRRAAYLRFGGRILGLCDPDVEPGPLHLRLDRLPELRVGQAVVLSGGRLELDAGRVSIDLGRARRWAPPRIEPEVLRRAADRSSGCPPSLGAIAAAELPASVVEDATGLVQDGDLVALARLVGGRGPGLTPAGDDLLAGALVADAALRPAAAAAAVRQDAAAAARTNDVAAAFLRWAAAGQSIQPVHDVLTALSEDEPRREEAARRRLLGIGASSGAALLLGLDLSLALGAAGARTTPEACTYR